MESGGSAGGGFLAAGSECFEVVLAIVFLARPWNSANDRAVLGLLLHAADCLAMRMCVREVIVLGCRWLARGHLPVHSAAGLGRRL